MPDIKKFLDTQGTTYLWSRVAAELSLKAAQSDLTTLQGRVNALVGEDTGKSARTIASEEIATQLIPANAGASLDTLQEIAAWIQSHPGDAAAMNSAITALQSKLTLGTFEDDNEQVEYATVKAYVEAEIAALESSAHSHSNKSVLDGISAADVSAWDAKVGSVVEGSANGTIAVDGTNVAVHGLGSAAYAATTDFDAAGAAAAVLGTAQDGASANTVYGAKAYADSLVTALTTAEIDAAILAAATAEEEEEEEPVENGGE